MEVLLGVGAALFFAAPLWMRYFGRQQDGSEHSRDGCLLMLFCGGWSGWALASVVVAGTVHSILSTLLLVWVWILLVNHVVSRSPVHSTEPERAAPSATMDLPDTDKHPWRHTLLMLILAAMTGGLLFAMLLPGVTFEFPYRLLLSALLFPLLWSLLTLWACVDRISQRMPLQWLLILSLSALLLRFQWH